MVVNEGISLISLIPMIIMVYFQKKLQSRPNILSRSATYKLFCNGRPTYIIQGLQVNPRKRAKYAEVQHLQYSSVIYNKSDNDVTNPLFTVLLFSYQWFHWTADAFPELGP